jgi:acyl-CoA hydrolase
VQGDASYADKKYEGSFKNNNFFVGKNVRKGVQEGRLDYTPVFLSEIPLLFRRGILPLDVTLITVPRSLSLPPSLSRSPLSMRRVCS